MKKPLGFKGSECTNSDSNHFIIQLMCDVRCASVNAGHTMPP